MKYTKVEEYTLTLSFKELRILKDLIRAAILLSNKDNDIDWIELAPEEIMLGKEIYSL